MAPTATGTAVRSPRVVVRRRRSSPGSVNRQIAQKRRGYAGAVLRALARAHRGRPTVEVQRVLKAALTPLGVRLSGSELHELAAGISAGKPVALP